MFLGVLGVVLNMLGLDFEAELVFNEKLLFLVDYGYTMFPDDGLGALKDDKLSCY